MIYLYIMKSYPLNLSENAWLDYIKRKRTIHELRAKESPQSPKVTMALLFRLAIAEFFKMSDKDIINLIRKEQLSETEQDLFS